MVRMRMIYMVCGTVELSRRSVARDSASFCKERDTRKRSALVNCSADWP
jgi:hypothetical protein